MTESIERYAKLLALFSALCLVEGVLFNIFFFLAFEVSGFSLLTVGDYLSTSAAHLPLVAIVGVASLVNAMLINRRGWVFRGMGVVAKNRRWLGAACIVAGSMSLVSAAMGVKRDAGNWAMISGGVGVVWILMTVAPRVEIETRRFAAALAMFALLTVVLCAQGFKRGAAIADSEQPVAILFTDNQREYRGALVGVFDRATVFQTKPENQLIVLTNKSIVNVEEFPKPPAEPIGWRAWKRAKAFFIKAYLTPPPQ